MTKPASDHARLAVVFGPPSAATAAVVRLLQTVGEMALSDIAVTEVNSLDDWEALRSADNPSIAVSHYPSPEVLSHIVAERAVPAIIVAADAAPPIASPQGDGHADIRTIRAISASVSCLAGILAMSEAQVQSQNSRNLAAFLARLTEARHIEISASVLEEIELHAIELAVRLSELCRHAQALTTDPPSAADDLTVAVVPQSADLRLLDYGVEVTWPGAAFLQADRPDTAMLGPIDLAGPARCLLYGPYFHLPAGAWRACLAIALAGCDGVHSFTVEIVCGDVIAKGRFETQASGLFETEIEFDHHRPHVPLELRLAQEAGAIYGWLSRFEARLVSKPIQRLIA